MKKTNVLNLGKAKRLLSIAAATIACMLVLAGCENENPPGGPATQTGAEPSLISGTIKSATAGTIDILSSNGEALSFGTEGADTSKCNGLEPGSMVEIFYTGQIAGTDTSGAKVVSMQQPLPIEPTTPSDAPSSPDPGPQAQISGVIEDATMNTIAILSDDGRKLSFGTDGADTSGCSGLAIGTRVDIFYTGDIVDTDASGAVVVRMEQPEVDAGAPASPTDPSPTDAADTDASGTDEEFVPTTK